MATVHADIKAKVLKELRDELLPHTRQAAWVEQKKEDEPTTMPIQRKLNFSCLSATHSSMKPSLSVKAVANTGDLNTTQPPRSSSYTKPIQKPTSFDRSTVPQNGRHILLNFKSLLS
jgi:hypothetical protein